MTQNATNQDDLRVRRTRKMLQQALIDLTIEKGFAAITIQDITERAMVNRSTFYRHYLDKCDLMGQYMHDVYALISNEAFIPADEWQNTPIKPAGLVNLLRHIQDHAAFYKIMLGPQGDAGFTDDFRKNIEKRLQFLLKYYSNTTPDMPPLTLCLSYLASAAVGAIIWWLESNLSCSPEQLALWISDLSMKSVDIEISPTKRHPTSK